MLTILIANFQSKLIDTEYWYYIDICSMCWSGVTPPEVANDCHVSPFPKHYDKLTDFYLLNVFNYLVFKYEVDVFIVLLTLEIF